VPTIGVDPRAAVSPAQGPAINTQLADAAERQQEVPILLVNLLKAAHDNASEWLELLPVWFQTLRSTKDSLPQDEEALQDHQEELNKKQAEIDTLHAKFEELMQMMPKAQEEHLQQVREETRLTMQRDKEKLNRLLEDCVRGMERKRDRIAKLEGSVRSLKSGIPETIKTLKALVTQLPSL
jgi:chromosome segregation ATPase